jgi:hypothetical protein
MTTRKKPGTDEVLRFSEHVRKRVDELESDLDMLFKLPMPEFTGARNELAARLKKSGRGDDAARVKALVKPPISAWAVNQLYWNHRAAFDRLIASGERFHKAQTSGKIVDMRSALDARREALADLSDLATSLLRDAGHNPSLDTIRRITSTLEAMSANSDRASRSDAPRPGRLTHDVDPPGFESFSSFVPAAGMTKTRKEPPRFTPSQKSSGPPPIKGRKVAPDNDLRHLEETRKAKMAAAKVAVQNAKKSLTQARARGQSLEAAQKKADADAKQAEKLRRKAEESLEKAKAAFEDAAERARSVAVEVEEVASALDDAERTVEKASRELDSLLRESSRS